MTLGEAHADADAHLCALLPRGDPRDRRREGARAHHRRRLHREHPARAARRALSVRIDLARVPVLPVFRWLAADRRHRRDRDAAHVQLRHRHDRGGGDPTRPMRSPRCFAREGETVSAARRGRRAAAGDARASSTTARSTCVTMTRKRVAILISGRGSNMAALIEAAQAHGYPAEIALVRLQSRRMRAGSRLARAGRRADRGARSQALRQGSRGVRGRAAGHSRPAPHRTHLPWRLHAAVHARNSCSAGTAACSTSIRPCCRRFPGSIRTARRCAPA